MMVMELIHSFGLEHRIDQVHKVLLFLMNMESMNNKLLKLFTLIKKLKKKKLFLFFFCRTNILERYFNKEFTLTLPDKKKMTEIKWLAVYDLNSQNNFGDIYIPEEFEPPMPQKISSFTKRSHNVSSEALEILDSKTIRLPEFSYDGKGKKAYFWTGVGPQPSSKGNKIPDEMG